MQIKKRLITIFDEKITTLVINDSDVIFTNNPLAVKHKGKIYALSNVDDTDIDSSLFAYVNSFFEFLPSEFGVLKNDIYVATIRPIIHVLYQIQNIVKVEGITEILLVGGSKKQFLTLSAAEGEGNKKWYRSSWMFNSFIADFYRNDEAVLIIWEKRINKFIHSFFYNIREGLFHSVSLFSLFVKSIKKSENIYKNNIDDERKIVVAFADLDLQYRHLHDILSRSKSFQIIYVLHRNLVPIEGDNAKRKEEVSFLKVLKLEREIHKCKYPKFREIVLFGRKISINLKELVRGSLSVLIRAMAEEMSVCKSLENIGRNNICCVVTDKTIGHDICVVNSASRFCGIYHVNIQHVAMGPILYPELNLADCYMLYSKKTYELYHEYSDSYRYFIPMQSKLVVEENNQKLCVTIFTQPDWYAERYINAIRQILCALENSNKNICFRIKLHYRQNKVDDFDRIVNDYPNVILIKDGNAGDEIRRSDLILSMTSSVLFEALTNRIPGLIINFDKLDEKTIYESGVCVPEVNTVIDSPIDFVSIITHFAEFKIQYKEKLNAFLEQNGGGYNIDAILMRQSL